MFTDLNPDYWIKTFEYVTILNWQDKRLQKIYNWLVRVSNECKFCSFVQYSSIFVPYHHDFAPYFAVVDHITLFFFFKLYTIGLGEIGSKR